MKRLTYRNGREEWCALTDEREVTSAVTERLAAYEDTGLEPEVILKQKEGYRLQYESLKEILDAMKSIRTTERLRELDSAEAEGRLIVLPCKVGDSVYEHDAVRVYELTVRSIIFDTNGAAFDKSAIGKTVFLTREEAEVSLRGERKKNPKCGGCFYWNPPVRGTAECRILARTGWVFSDDPACEKYIAREVLDHE